MSELFKYLVSLQQAYNKGLINGAEMERLAEDKRWKDLAVTLYKKEKYQYNPCPTDFNENE